MNGIYPRLVYRFDQHLATINLNHTEHNRIQQMYNTVGSCWSEQRTTDLLFLLMDLVALGRLPHLRQLMEFVALSRVYIQLLGGGGKLGLNNKEITLVSLI